MRNAGLSCASSDRYVNGGVRLSYGELLTSTTCVMPAACNRSTCHAACIEPKYKPAQHQHTALHHITDHSHTHQQPALCCAARLTFDDLLKALFLERQATRHSARAQIHLWEAATQPTPERPSFDGTAQTRACEAHRTYRPQTMGLAVSELRGAA
jgi:hypothetical protein